MIKVVYEPQNNRAAAYADEEFIGESTYSKSDKLWIIDHTYVEDQYGGQGIAAQLVDELVKEARKNQMKIIPLCPYAKRRFQIKKEYADVLFSKSL